MFPLHFIFIAMAVNLNASKAADVEKVVGFRFPDTGESFTVHVRRGVAEIQPRFPDAPDLALTVDSNIWKEVAVGLRNPTVALFKDMEKAGSILELVKFLGLFKE